MALNQLIVRRGAKKRIKLTFLGSLTTPMNIWWHVGVVVWFSVIHTAYDVRTRFSRLKYDGPWV
jgi:hypothetical protein